MLTGLARAGKWLPINRYEVPGELRPKFEDFAVQVLCWGVRNLKKYHVIVREDKAFSQRKPAGKDAPEIDEAGSSERKDKGDNDGPDVKSYKWDRADEMKAKKASIAQHGERIKEKELTPEQRLELRSFERSKIVGRPLQQVALYILLKMNLVPDHVETRTLFTEMAGNTPCGELRMFVDLFPLSYGGVPPPINIVRREPEKYQLRVALFNVSGAIPVKRSFGVPKYKIPKEEVDTVNLFDSHSLRGWWPVLSQKRPMDDGKSDHAAKKKKDDDYDAEQLYIMGLLEMEMSLVTAAEAASDPVGKKRKEPNHNPYLPKPLRSNWNMFWITSRELTGESEDDLLNKTWKKCRGKETIANAKLLLFIAGGYVGEIRAKFGDRKTPI
ncbi:hypothetical protein NECAME_12002 [Necator americanus]|uniref:Ferlin C-terminal domain-containing protein n=1 Tax=Necator americanus TaxID=51031 RepID=W2T334_NECAM|nr:hypothetical protein NECAME_12002 [Necator americanus]ETN75974.1 hypothetical protein NECAME_12002 [Necator americanus]